MRPTLRCLNAIKPYAKTTSFIGLGRMGREMAFNLFSKQFAKDNTARFVVCDALTESSAAFKENFLGHFPGAHIEVAKTPAEAAAASQTIVTMLPSSPEVKTVYYESLLPVIRNLPVPQKQGLVCIDSTTLDVVVAKEVAQQVGETGAQMVDAPVSGGVTGAKAGTLSFLVGGTPEAFAQSLNTLSLMGQRIIHCGPSGAGLGAKICNNLVLGVQQIVIGEAMLLGQKLGLEPNILASVINSSTGSCWASTVNNPVPTALPEKSPPCERDYEGGFATALMLKDMGLATNIGKQTGSPLPLGKAAEELYAKAPSSLVATTISLSPMSDSANKPSAIIFGGLNTFSRALAAYLIPLNGEPLVSHLRIVDKFSVHPPTTYIGSEFPKVLEKPNVEYKQVNLTIQSAVSSCFDPPEGASPYEYVFDFTGEVTPDRTDLVLIRSTLNVARYIGTEAAKRKVKAYVRVHQPFYDTLDKKGQAKEAEDVKPTGDLGIWWHESLRALAAIDDLNLVILRVGNGYGPFTTYGTVAAVIPVISVYGYLKKPMKALWSPGKHATNTVHVDDIAGAAWACAQWIAKKGRAEGNLIAGEKLPFHNDKKKAKEEGLPDPDRELIAPVYNIVDDSHSTHVSLGSTVAAYFGTTCEFFGVLENAWIKVLETTGVENHMLEEINEHHVGGWTEMVTKSDPPIQHTYLTAYMDKHQLAKHTVGLDNAKIKEIVGYQLKKPEFTQDAIKEIVDKWKVEEIWPNLK